LLQKAIGFSFAVCGIASGAIGRRLSWLRRIGILSRLRDPNPLQKREQEDNSEQAKCRQAERHRTILNEGMDKK
jgi:hypothetical protein